MLSWLGGSIHSSELNLGASLPTGVKYSAGFGDLYSMACIIDNYGVFISMIVDT